MMSICAVPLPRVTFILILPKSSVMWCKSLSVDQKQVNTMWEKWQWESPWGGGENMICLWEIHWSLFACPCENHTLLRKKKNRTQYFWLKKKAEGSKTQQEKKLSAKKIERAKNWVQKHWTRCDTAALRPIMLLVPTVVGNAIRNYNHFGWDTWMRRLSGSSANAPLHHLLGSGVIWPLHHLLGHLHRGLPEVAQWGSGVWHLLGWGGGGGGGESANFEKVGANCKSTFLLLKSTSKSTSSPKIKISSKLNIISKN